MQTQLDIFEGPVFDDALKGAAGGITGGYVVGYLGAFLFGQILEKDVSPTAVANHGAGILGTFVVAVVFAGHVLAPVLT